MSWRQQALGGGLSVLLIGISGGAAAQSAVTGTILSGALLAGGAGGSARLVLGSRVVSPPRSWTEVVFSDGSSIVLGPGAALAVQQIASNPGSARNRISATGSGQIRIVAMDGMEVELATTGVTVTVIAADAVLQAVPHGSVAILGGHEVVVSQRSRRDTLRRPGFSVPLDGAGPQRDSNQQIVAALAPFASSGPSQSPSAAESAPPSATPAPPSATPAPTRAQRARRGPTLAVSPSALAAAEIPIAGSTDLTTGLTAQSGSLTVSPLLKVSAPALIAVIAPTPTPVVNPAVPDLNYSSYTPAPPVTAPAPVLNPTPNPTPQPSFIAVDSALLAGMPGTAGPITVPGTTTSVSAGLVPSNEHLTWGFFVPAGSSATTPAMALASPALTFLISSTALPNGSLQTLTGTATYAGGLIANTLGTSGTLRQTGQFAQTWNFGTRSGAITAVFDGTTWRNVALTSLPVGLSGYSGTGTSTADQRSISFSGAFYNSTTVSPGSFPGATGGTFYVGASGPGHPVTGGLFVGTRR